MLEEVRRFFQHAQQKATDFDFLERVKEGCRRFGPQKSVHVLPVGSHKSGISLEHQEVLPAYPARRAGIGTSRGNKDGDLHF